MAAVVTGSDVMGSLAPVKLLSLVMVGRISCAAASLSKALVPIKLLRLAERGLSTLDSSSASSPASILFSSFIFLLEKLLIVPL